MTTARNLIILAEDMPEFNAACVGLFQRLGYEVMAFPDGQAALAGIGALKPEEVARAILVTDWQMPNLDGPGLVRAVRAEPTLNMPIMMWTSGSSDRDIAFMLGKGADYALGKIPLLNERIMPALEATCTNFAKPKGIPSQGARSH